MIKLCPYFALPLPPKGPIYKDLVGQTFSTMNTDENEGHHLEINMLVSCSSVMKYKGSLSERLSGQELLSREFVWL